MKGKEITMGIKINNVPSFHPSRNVFACDVSWFGYIRLSPTTVEDTANRMLFGVV